MAKRSRKAFDKPRTSTFVYDPDELVVIGHDTGDKPGHPLYRADCNDPIDPAFQENIYQNGVDATVDITKWEGRPCVVEGRTRVRAARIANKRRAKEGLPLIKIKCQVVSGTEIRLARRAIRANHVRKVTSPLQKAEDAAYLLEQGMTPEEAAVELGVTSAQTVKQWIAILGATADVRRAVAAEKISTAAAAKIAKLEGGDAQKKALAEVLASGTGSTVAARRAVNNAGAKSAKGSKPTSDGVGIVSRRQQATLLEIAGGSFEDVDADYYAGFADALRIILGKDASDTRAEWALLQLTKTLDEKKAA